MYCKDSSKQHGASLGPLSGGRVSIIAICVGNLKCAITIAIRYMALSTHNHHFSLLIRYSAVRKQFGPSSGEEVPVLEYQLQVGRATFVTITVFQQYRLLPYLSAAYAWSCYGVKIHLDFVGLMMMRMAGEKSDETVNIKMHVHT